MSTTSSSDDYILERYQRGETKSVESLILRYQQKIFGLVISLTNANRDKAYDIAASVFVEAICTTAPFGAGESFYVRLLHSAIEKCRDISRNVLHVEVDLKDRFVGKRGPLRIVNKALQDLPFEARGLILLRDQLRLSFTDIVAVLRISAKDVRMQLIKARASLREKIKEDINHE